MFFHFVSHIAAKSVPNFWNLMIFDVRGITPTGPLKFVFSFFLKIVASCYSKFVCFLFSSHFLALMFIEKILEKRFFSWILETAIYREFQKKTQKYVFLLILQSITYWCFKKYVYFFIFLKKSFHRVTLSLFVFCFFYTFWNLYYTWSKKRTKKRKKSVEF